LEKKPSKGTEVQTSGKKVDEEKAEDHGLFCCPVDGSKRATKGIPTSRTTSVVSAACDLTRNTAC